MGYSVIAKCQAYNNGKWESFETEIAQFNDPWHAYDFIEKCLPPENHDRFYVKSNRPTV